MSGSAVRRRLGRRFGFAAAGFAVTALAGAVFLRIVSAPPLEAYGLIVAGAFGSPERVTFVLAAWAPVLLAAAGLLVTFAAGLWNIGIEGQVVFGAIFATGALRALEHSGPGWAALTAAGLAAAAGGTVWALLAGALRTYGGVSEIFGGLGLNFIAGSLTVYLVLGPWARPGIASTSGTVPFGAGLWLPALRVPPVAVPGEVLLALAAIGAVSAALRGTCFGLYLAAIGRSLPAAHLRGIPTTREILRAFALCGALAGLGGFVLVAGAYSRHQLFPLISGGDGYLAILVVLLAGQSAAACAFISAAFAAISMGSLQLPLAMQLDSSMGGVIQGLLVLSVILLRGLQSRFMRGEA
ncbi:MAG TPA: ABC transporter permease [bacterium]|nr:ABC transporter permease [bacterium]